MAGTLTFTVVDPSHKADTYVLTLTHHDPKDWDEQSIKEDIQGGDPIFKDIGSGLGRSHESEVRLNASNHDDLRTEESTLQYLRKATGSVTISLHGWTPTYSTMKLWNVTRSSRVSKEFVYYTLQWWETQS